jgi:hypothetical protein
MRAFVITLVHDAISRTAADRCIESIRETQSKLIPEIWPAITPDTLFECEWRWPTSKKQICSRTGLELRAYKNADVRKRIACAQSHYRLWEKCVELEEPICILEHDAVFGRQFKLEHWQAGALSINDPRGATFNADHYHDQLIDGENEVPWVADVLIPQGLPGHSAYVIQPWAAQQVIEAQDQVGWWPNDAIMCRQLFPWLRVYRPYFTTLQDIRSTTKN